jgi:hypothetical protein
MKSKAFGALAATAVAGILASGIALADNHGKAGHKDDGKAAKGKAGEKVAGVCKSNSCAGHVAGGKNECAGQVVDGVTTKDMCEKEGKGTWTAGGHK